MFKNKKNNKNNSELKELMSTPRGKAIVFFGAYLIFFIIIAVSARSGGGSSNPSDRVYETGNEKSFSMANIESNNYKYNYKIMIDDNYVTYNGIRYNNKEKFSCTNLAEFYKEDNNYFSNTSGLWIKSENPFIHDKFLDIKNINSLIENATYVSTTTFENGDIDYNFKISSASISKLFDNIDLDVSEEPNEIIVRTDETNYTKEIEFKLNSYCLHRSICTNKMSIKLSYSMVGEIEDITSPLS